MAKRRKRRRPDIGVRTGAEFVMPKDRTHGHQPIYASKVKDRLVCQMQRHPDKFLEPFLKATGGIYDGDLSTFLVASDWFEEHDMPDHASVIREHYSDPEPVPFPAEVVT